MCWFFNLYRYVMPLSSDRKNNDFQLYSACTDGRFVREDTIWSSSHLFTIL